MPWGTILICMVLAILFFFSIRHMMKKGTCEGDCGSCGCGCSGVQTETKQ